MLLALVAGFSMVPAVQPLSAEAAQYSQFFCQYSDNATAPTDGWTASNSGSFTFFGSSCGSGGGLETAWANNIEHAYATGAVWTYQAPANTSIAALYGTRTASAGTDRAFGSPVSYINTDQGQIEACSRFGGCGSLNGNIAYGLNGAQGIAVGITCGGGPGGSCPAGDPTTNSIKRGQIVLNDDSAPTFSSAPSGVLLSPSTTTRTRSLNYSAADAGGGVFQQRLIADATNVVVSSTIDENGGKCVKRGAGFSYRVPCRLSASGSVTLDTGVLADGDHELRLEVRDATEQNAVSQGPWPILVDNVAPILTGSTEVSGTAKAGQTLTCEAPSINGQNPTITYAWTRSSSDGSGRTTIAGATSKTYRLTRGDEAKKLQCTLTAQDKGGSSSRESSLTSGPFANGGVVGPGEGPTPSGSTQVAGSPVVGETLSILAASYPAGTTLAYAWLRCDTSGQGCATIPGATSSTYTLTGADAGRRMVGQVIATDEYGVSTSRSGPSGTVSPAAAVCPEKPVGPGTGPTEDFDGDGQPNCSDPDDDGDGVLDVNDPDPFDKNVPKNQSETTKPTTPSTPGAPAPVQVPASGSSPAPAAQRPLSGPANNGQNATSKARVSLVFAKNGGSRYTARYGSSPTLRGRVLNERGKPIGGAVLDVVSTPTMTGAKPSGKTGVKTRENGRFTIKLARNVSSREIAVIYRSNLEFEQESGKRAVNLRVRAGIRVKARQRSRNLEFSGRLLGRPFPAQGQVVELQFKSGKRYRTFGTVRVNRAGSFRFRYPSSKVLRGYRYEFRARVRSSGDYPYLTSASKPTRLLVR